ncbi:MAG TPA: DUF481 domain-containing protein [Longimicrobiales bacterium]|nr:DUF481 domain-containing protein [Longimicrobiales bacterium]
MYDKTSSFVVAVVILPALLFTPARAQDSRPWAYDAELGASVFFGASEQTAVLVRNRLEWSEDRLEFSLGGAFDYGEARDGDGDRFVAKRSWSAETSADYLPGGRASPFLFAGAEGSYERQIALRASGGAGAKYRFIESDAARVDFSLAALLERTEPRPQAGAALEVSSVGRWSARFRARRDFSAAQLQLVTFFRPNIEDFEDRTWDLTATATYALTDALGLRASVVNRYDSLAESRGARANHDGRVFFSVVATLK